MLSRVLVAVLCVMALLYRTAAVAAASESCAALFAENQLVGIVPNAPGGGRDTLMRVLVAQLETKHRFISTKVVNMPGGRTVPAMRAVAEPQPGVLAIGIFNAPEVILPTPDMAERPSRADIPALATIVRESNVWLTREDFDLSALAGKTVVLGASSFNSRTALDFLFPVSLLGGKSQMITSYGGSGESTVALLRGDIDVDPVRVSTGKSALKSGGLRISLTLSEGPLPGLDGVPYLTGPGSILETFAAKASPDQRARMDAQAAASVALSPSVLTIHTSRHYEDATIVCLEAAVEDVILSSSYTEETKAFEQPVTPLDREQTDAMIDEMEAAYVRIESDLAKALAPFLEKP